jgi:hypothetical protein
LKESRCAQRILNVPFEYGTLGTQIPEDLRLSVSEAHLGNLAETAAQQVAVETPALLALVAYFYAIGEFSSEEIEKSLSDCPLSSARELAFENTDIAATIRHFRREYRRAIEEALALVFRGAQPFAPLIEIQNEARSRIYRAIQTDCWALDD